MSTLLPVHDARRVPNGAVLEYDLCVVGSGAAAVTSVLSLARRGLRIAVLEGGGLAPDASTGELLRMDCPRKPVGFDSRERWLGGTTNAWTGGKTTLDDIDLASRPWVPNSGWPMTGSELRALYARAATLLDRPPPEWFDPPHVCADGMILDSADLRTVAFHVDDEPLRFGDLLRSRLGPRDGVDLFVLANVTEVILDDGGTAVGGVSVSTLTDTTFVVRSRCVMLACGAIENARLLLASHRQRPGGLGNAGDLVGRYYQDHPKGYTGVITVDPQAGLLPASPYWGRATAGGKQRWGVALTGAAQERLAVLNSYVRIEPVVHDTTPPGITAARKILHGRVRELEAAQLTALGAERSELARLARFRLRNRGPIDAILVRSFLEQEPTADSRVRLSERRDRFGVPLPVVDWGLTELDRRSVRALHDMLGTEISRRGLGTLQSPLDDDSPAWDALVDAAHHAGTTRMGLDARTSVTDPHGEIHDVSGLFVNGASLFPTSGYANPVFTIAAVALRVADRVASRLGVSSAAIAQPERATRPTPAGIDETRRWVATRTRRRRLTPPVSQGLGVVWTAPQVAELLPCEVEKPGAGQVSVLVEVSAVSPGTERAAWLRQPGTSIGLPHRPGYSLSGLVAGCGPGVYDLEPGMPVAVWGPPHRSIVTVDRRQVHQISEHADRTEASLITLGAIAALGVTRAEPVAGRTVAVIGSGPIGLLAQRLAIAQGATRTVIVAASSAKENAALASAPVEVCRPGDIDSVNADIVIEATGQSTGFQLAVRAAATAGTVVLLGTTRAENVTVPLDLIQRAKLRIVGAHMSILDRGSLESFDRGDAAAMFLRHWNDGALDVSTVISDRVDPRDIGALYDRLAVDRTMLVPVIEWWRLPDELRHDPGPLTLPNPFRRGLTTTGLRPPTLHAPSIVDYPPPPARTPKTPSRTIATRARAVCAAIDCADSRGPVRIEGENQLSDKLRRRLNERAGGPDDRRGLIVVNTDPDSASIERSLRDLDPTSLLIISSTTASAEIDLQRLVHRTGATFIVT